MMAIQKRQSLLKPALVLTWVMMSTATLVGQESGKQSETTKSVTEPFTSIEGGFSAIFPLPPKHTEGLVVDANGVKVTEQTFTAGTSSEAYLVSYSDDGDAAEGKSSKELLALIESRADDFLARAEAFIKERKTISIRSGENTTVPAVEYAVGLNDRTEVARIVVCLANNRFYQIGVIGPSAFVAKPETDTFLKSFRILQQPGARTFTSTEVGFRINFPKEPKLTVQDLATGSGGTIVQSQYLCELADGTYMVSAQDSDESAAETPESLKSAFDSTRDRLANALKGKVLQEKNVVVGKSIAARELRISIPDAGGEYRTRIFFANRRFYQIIAVGAAEFANSRATDSLFDSFALIEASASDESGVPLEVFESQFGRFGIQLVLKPVYSRAAIDAGDGTKVVRHQYIAGERPEAVFITFVDLPEGVTDGNGGTPEFFELIATSLSKEFKGELRNLRRIDSQRQQDGWSFDIESDQEDNSVRGRLFVRQGRFYQVLAVGRADFVSSPTSEAILASFETHD